jgi:hypothetical protein
MKLDLLTNATVVDDAIRFISRNQNQKEDTKDRENLVTVAAASTATVNQVF